MAPFAHAQQNGSSDRRAQILSAAMVCFAKCGFHQTSMQDISEEAGISVGLIYRYFENKDAVISAMAEEHKREIEELLVRAGEAAHLRDALEILFTAHCCENAPQIVSAFVVDLYAEASRNPKVAALVRDILETSEAGVTKLIAASPEGHNFPQAMTPPEMTELIFATARGMMMRDVLETASMSAAQRRDHQLTVVRNLWRLLFEHANEPALS